MRYSTALQWRHNEHDGISNHQPRDCLLNYLLRRRSNKTSKLRVTGLCAGNSPVTGEFPAQKASNAENVSIWWRHHGSCQYREKEDFLLLSNRITPYLIWFCSKNISFSDYSTVEIDSRVLPAITPYLSMVVRVVPHVITFIPSSIAKDLWRYIWLGKP